MDIDNDVKVKLKVRMSENGWHWKLSGRLFGDIGCDIGDFEIFNYTYLLDNSRTREDLIAGLREISPLADDALAIAEQMSDQNFCDFKLALIQERKIAWQEEDGGSVMPEMYSTLLIPKLFICAFFIADKFQVPLGAALIRIINVTDSKPKDFL